MTRPKPEAIAILSEALEALRAGRLGVAETLSRKLLAALPNDAATLQLAGNVALRLGRFEEAEARARALWFIPATPRRCCSRAARLYWHLIVKSWKQLIAKVVLPRTSTPEIGSKPDSAPFDGKGNEAEAPTPYTYDSRRDRGDSSLHLSC